MPGIIKVPAEALEGAQSFAIDFGGSVLKLLYIKKDDVHPEGFKLVRQQSFARADFQQALDFIKKECDIPTEADGKPRAYFLTGFGITEIKEDLKEQLNIGVSIAFELDCFEESFRLLVENFSPEELYYPPEYVDDGVFTQKMAEFAGEMCVRKAKEDVGKEKEDVQFAAKSEGDSDKWPCLMAMLGSAFGLMKLNGDGTQQQCSAFSSLGGRTFLGLGSLLTGAQTYKELMDLAEKGNHRTVNCFLSDMVKAAKEGETENFYCKFAGLDANFLSFAWCVGKGIDDFKREDLARALLAYTCKEIVVHCSQTCKHMKVGRVVLVGSFAQSPLARRLIEEYFMKTVAFGKVIAPENALDITCQTLRAGSHLGALGAMLQSAKKPIEKDA